MIKKEMIRNGFERGVVEIINEDEKLGGAVCHIGIPGMVDWDGWFYFGGQEAEDCTAAEYLTCVPMDDIIDEIFDTLEDMRNHPDVFDLEYALYEDVLRVVCKED